MASLHFNPIVALIVALVGSLVRVAFGLRQRGQATITSDVTSVPLNDPGEAGPESVRRTQYGVLGVNSGERPIDCLKLTARCGAGSRLTDSAAVTQPATSGMMLRVLATDDGLECEVPGLGPGQGLSLSFVLESKYRSDVEFEWTRPSGRVAVVSSGPAAVSPGARFGRLAGVGAIGFLVMEYVPRFAHSLPGGDVRRAAIAASWAVAAGCFAWVGFGLYDLLRDALRPRG
jgi:hypothetical protein